LTRSAPPVARRARLRYSRRAEDHGEARMATNDDLLQERREMWHKVTRVTTIAVAVVAVILLLMLLFLT
jgi:negative regulator of sigma E activity